VIFAALRPARRGQGSERDFPTARRPIDFRWFRTRSERDSPTVEQFITQQGFYIVRKAPDIENLSPAREGHQGYWGPGYKAARVAMDDPAVQPGGKRDGTDACVASDQMPCLRQRSHVLIY